MAGATTVTLVGGLTADPETRTVGSSVVANFSIAVSERQFDRDTSEWVEKGTSFYRCAAWRELGEHVASSLSKGDRVVAQGTLRERSYEKDGETRKVWEVEIDEIGPSLRFASAVVTRTTGGNRNQQARQQQARQPQQAAQPRQQPQQATAWDDETPF